MSSKIQSLLLFILSLAVVVVLNLLLSNQVWRFDLTENKEYSLSDSTVKLLDRLEDRLTIKLYFSKDLPSAMLPLKQKLDDVLQEYQTRSSKDIVVEVIHPDLNEESKELAQVAGVQPVEVNVIEKDQQQIKRVYLGLGLYYKDQKQVIPVLTDVSNLEYVIDLSVLKMTQKTLPTVGYFVSENQEAYSLLPQLIGQIAKPIDLKNEKAWSDLNLTSLVLVNPIDLEPSHLKFIKELQEQKVPILIFASTQKVSAELKSEPVQTGLEEFFDKMGLALSDGFVIDPKYNQQAGFQRGIMKVYLPYPFWVKSGSQHLSDQSIITKPLEELLFPWANQIQILADQKPSLKVEVLAKSSEHSFIQASDQNSIDPDYLNSLTELPQMEERPLLVMVQEKDQAPIFVSGSSSMIEDRFLQQVQSNAILLVNALEMATWGDYLIGVRSRAVTTRPLVDLTYENKQLIKWGVTFGSPLLLVVFCLLFLSFRRKRRQKMVLAIQSA